MFAVFTAPDALVMAAAVPVLITSVLGWWNSRELKTNGGGSARDALNEIRTEVRSLSTRMTAVEEFITKPNPKEA